jgi:pyruvate,water dikinase
MMLKQLHQAYSELPKSKQSIVEKTATDFPGDIRVSEFGELFYEFMNRFGHLSDSGNDFSRVSWRETPELVLGMIKSMETSRRAREMEGKEALREFLEEKRMNEFIYSRAMRYQEYRELVNSLYTYGYSQFRRYFLHLASLLENEGILDNRNDIFYLEYQEILSLIDGKSDVRDAKKRIAQRKTEMEEFADFALPEVIFGDTPPLNIDQRRVGKEMTGVASSGGTYVGPAKIVTGLADFTKIEEGDVLVIPYSDVSWTPLFSKAKAVVSESGGLLAHCSIVAREYGIPAVVSVHGAMSIEDGATLAVDGNNGLVILLE